MYLCRGRIRHTLPLCLEYLPHIYFLFTARLRIFHVCRNENFRNRHLSFYWKKWFYIWYVALAWWLVPCLPFPFYCTSTSCLPCDLELFMFAIMKFFVTDISASTGRNDFIFDIWLFWHGDLYRVSLFQAYRTSTSCLPRDLEFFMFVVMKPFVTDISASTGRNDFIFDMWFWHGDLYPVSPFQVYLPCDLRIFHAFTVFSGNECWDIYKFDTNERVGMFLARRSVQHLVLIYIYILVVDMLSTYSLWSRHLWWWLPV